MCINAYIYALLEDDGLPQVRMQRPPQVHPLPALGAAADDLEVAGDGAPLLVVHEAGLLVADPGVGAAAARVHPEDVAEAEVVAQRGVDDLDGHGHELPALEADVGLVAARAHVVVVGQIDVEAELLRERLEGALVPQRLAVARVRRVHGPDLETRGEFGYDVFSDAAGREREVSPRKRVRSLLAAVGRGEGWKDGRRGKGSRGLQVGGWVGLVSEVYLVAGGIVYGQGELAVAEVVGRGRAVVQPLE